MAHYDQPEWLSMTDNVGMAWWNRASAAERAHWLRIACSARPVDAYRAYVSDGFSPDQMMLRGKALNAWRDGNVSALLAVWDAARAHVVTTTDPRWATVEFEAGTLMAHHNAIEPYYPRVSAIVEVRESATSESEDMNP